MLLGFILNFFSNCLACSSHLELKFELRPACTSPNKNPSFLYLATVSISSCRAIPLVLFSSSYGSLYAEAKEFVGAGPEEFIKAG